MFKIKTLLVFDLLNLLTITCFSLNIRTWLVLEPAVAEAEEYSEVEAALAEHPGLKDLKACRHEIYLQL